MKTRIATIMLMLTVFLGTTAFANEPIPASSQVKKEVKQLIQKKLLYPQFAIDNGNESAVFVRLIIDKNGRLTVDCANCACGEMKKYTIKAIERIKSKDLMAYAGQTMNLKISYDLR